MKTSKALAIAAAVMWLGCGDDKGDDDGGVVTDTTAVADTAVAADTSAGADTTPASPTLYAPAVTYGVKTDRVQDISYADVLGETRAVNIKIYRPESAPLPAPVVLLSHGGSKGKTDPDKSMDQWAPEIAAAGYVAVAIAHPARDQVSYDALCGHLGVSPAIPCALKINWDRPHDVTRVLLWLEERAQTEPYMSALDLTRIAHVGHSAGSGAGMMLAGATRNYLCAQPFGMDQGTTVPCDVADLVSKHDARIDAIIAMSPQGPGSDGFMTESFTTVDVPVLIGTGQQDGDPGEPANRVDAYAQLAPSAGVAQRFMIYVDDPGAQHTLFEAEVDACERETTADRCADMRSWLLATGLAFLDSELRGVSAASAWLASDAVDDLSAGAATLSRK